MKSACITLPRMGVSATSTVLVTVSSALPATAQETRIAAVNSKRTLHDSQPAKAAQAKLGTEFAKCDRELQDMVAKLKDMSDKLDKDSAVLADFDRNYHQRELSNLGRDFQRKQRKLREDLNQRRNEGLIQVFERANRMICSTTEQREYDLIVQEAVYMSSRIDIMDEMLKALNPQSAR